jgi:nitronate monooxygenase
MGTRAGRPANDGCSWIKEVSMLSETLKARLTLPVVCAPMFLVSGPDLVREACRAGVIGGLPRPNARTPEQFESWLRDIRAALDADPNTATGPVAINFDARLSAEEQEAILVTCEKYGVEIIVSAGGDPAQTARRVHDHGMQIIHDVTNVRFAHKAIAAGVDGLVCIGAGGGGHSGVVSHLALIPKIRSLFDGIIVCAGAISTGHAVRAAEVLGADLAYLGTRFVATRESMAPGAYKSMLVDASAADLFYMVGKSGIPANWLGPSLKQSGVDLAAASRFGDLATGELGADLPLWSEVWSGGQGVEMIDDVPTVAELVARLRTEYSDACATPTWNTVDRLVDQALDR